jgi:hypothetical protein
MASALLAVLLFLSWGATARAESEATVKAAYILNFAKLVDWPTSAFNSGPTLIVGVLGRDPVGDEMARILPGATANGRKIEVRRVSAGNTAALRSCHLVFIPESERGESVVAAVRGNPVLVIGESENFLQQGGALSFVKVDGTVKFEANTKGATRNGVTLSARLLRIAQTVVER